MSLILNPVSAILSISEKVIDRIWPDPAQAASAKLELIKLQQSGELQQIMGQVETNKAEAAHDSIWVAGWRPFIGWVCGVAFAYKFVIAPMIVLMLSVFGKPMAPLPVLDFTEMSTILLGMLGLGGYRTIEKLKGVETRVLEK